jgi:hypothetical protein
VKLDPDTHKGMHSVLALKLGVTTGGFYLRTQSYHRTTVIMGPILDMVIVSRAIVGMLCEEKGRHVNLGLLPPFTLPVRADRFTSSVVTPRAIKLVVALAHTYILSHKLPSHPRLLPCT